MLSVVILLVGDLAQLAPKLARAIDTNKLATCAFLFVVNIIGILANFQLNVNIFSLICQDVFNF